VAVDGGILCSAEIMAEVIVDLGSRVARAASGDR